MLTEQDKADLRREDALFDAKQEAAYEYTLEYQRALWRWCAEIVGRSWCHRHHGHETATCPAGREIHASLLSSIDDVPDLDVLIRKVEPDMMAFRESLMTLAERYRF